MEVVRGVAALKQLPFVEVSLSRDRALDVLTQGARRIYRGNMGLLIAALDPSAPHYLEDREYLILARDQAESRVSRGGLALIEGDIDRIYGTKDRTTFVGLNEGFMTDVFPQLSSTMRSRNPGIEGFDYMLDLLQILDPEIANFDDGVQAVIEALRRTRYALRPFVLGAMVDDSLNVRGTKDMPIDLFADQEGARQFREAFLRFANLPEKLEFISGLDATMNDLQIAAYGFSTN